MGVARFQPVITERTNAHHINWARMKKIAIEASEQSGRNNVPQIAQPVKFDEFIRNRNKEQEGIAFADERMASNDKSNLPIPCSCSYQNGYAVLIGPEGGFSDNEFAALDEIGATGISLGPTILRAEVAAVVAITKAIHNDYRL